MQRKTDFTYLVSFEDILEQFKQGQWAWQFEIHNQMII